MIAQLENAARFTFRQVPRCFERAITLSVVLDALTCVKMVKAAKRRVLQVARKQPENGQSMAETLKELNRPRRYIARQLPNTQTGGVGDKTITRRAETAYQKTRARVRGGVSKGHVVTARSCVSEMRPKHRGWLWVGGRCRCRGL